MVENNDIELTEQETELYDRQIRLWGLESQKRLRAARVLLCGLGGFGAEIAKNILLAGIKSLTLLEHRSLGATDACSQFLAPGASLGQNRAEASLQRAAALNPMVEIRVDTEDVAGKPDEFFGDFDVVVVTEQGVKQLERINRACRVGGVSFFAGDVWGMFGWSVADLQEHNFVEDVVKHKIIAGKPNEKPRTEKIVQTSKRQLVFPPLDDVLAFDVHQPLYQKKLRRTGPALLLLKVLQAFREAEQRDPLPAERAADVARLQALRKELGFDASALTDAYFGHVFAQVAPVAAIVGGELAQEIIKAVSQKEAPHHNVFLFDPETCCGFVESIGVQGN